MLKSSFRSGSRHGIITLTPPLISAIVLTVGDVMNTNLRVFKRQSYTSRILITALLTLWRNAGPMVS